MKHGAGLAQGTREALAMTAGNDMLQKSVRRSGGRGRQGFWLGFHDLHISSIVPHRNIHYLIAIEMLPSTTHQAAAQQPVSFHRLATNSFQFRRSRGGLRMRRGAW